MNPGPRLLPFVLCACATVACAGGLAGSGRGPLGRSSESNAPVVAVFDVHFERVPFDADLQEGMSAYVAGRLAECGSYRVVPRDRVKALIARQKVASFQDLYERETQVELGRELAAGKSVATLVLRFGGRCVVSSTLFDLRAAITEKAATREGDCSEEAIGRSLRTVTAQLCGADGAAPDDREPPGITSGESAEPGASHPIADASSGPASQVLARLEAYRVAIEERDLVTLKSLISRSYWSNAGTPQDPDDDYGHDIVVEEMLPMLAERITSVQYAMHVRAIQFPTPDRAIVEFEYSSFYFVWMDGQRIPVAKNDFSRMEFRNEDGFWRIVGGL